MWTKLASYLGPLIVKYVLPYVSERLEIWWAELRAQAKKERAYKAASKESKEKYDEIANKPGVTTDEMAQALTDLINSQHPR